MPGHPHPTRRGHRPLGAVVIGCAIVLGTTASCSGGDTSGSTASAAPTATTAATTSTDTVPTTTEAPATTDTAPTTTAPTSTTEAPATTGTAPTTTLPAGASSATCVNGWVTPEPWSDQSRTPYHRLRAFYGLGSDDIFVTEVMRYFHGPSPLFGGHDLEFWFIAGWQRDDTAFRGHWLVLRTPAAHPYGVLVEPFLFAPYQASTTPAGASWMSFWGEGEGPGTVVVPGLPGTYPGPGYPFVDSAGVPLLDASIAGCLPAPWLPVVGP